MNYGQRDSHRGRYDKAPYSPVRKLPLTKVDIANPDIELFDTTAKEIADILSEAGKKNKSSQMRKFYDEVIRFASRHKTGNTDEIKFSKDLPFIRMICAQAAYSQTRDHVDANFVDFMQHGIRQIKTPEHLHNFRHLFEAVIGFSPKSN
jgi:CRISPR-associated protein Csm2